MKLSGEVTIEASAERVWEIVGHGFASIGDWATAIEASHQDFAGARICETGLPGVPRVAETVVAYDEAERTLTYVATDVPRFFREARNRWRVSPAGADRSHARFDGVLELRGVVGLLVALPLRLRMRRETRTVLDDLKHYAEHGTPSPRKQRRLARS
jgi:Polyketide cyclase / dehydrase and lipid transport